MSKLEEERKRDEQEKNKAKDMEARMQEQRKQKLDEIIQQQKEKRAKDIEFKSKFEAFLIAKPITDIISMHDKSLKQIYDHYTEYNEFKLNK